jgi:hypothetical protein
MSEQEPTDDQRARAQRAAYMREYRATHPDRQARNRLLSRSDYAAAKIIVERHRAEYEQVRAQVRAEMGIEYGGHGGRPPLQSKEES